MPVFVVAEKTDREETGSKILIVDDNEIVRKVLQNTLLSEDYIVIEAENGIAALALALEHAPDLVITDLTMPEMDGIALIRELKTRDETRGIPVIMLTASGEIDSEVEGIEAGADDYLVKPVNPKKLIVRLKRLLRRR